MGNMDDYIGLSTLAKQSGGPAKLMEHLKAEGTGLGIGWGFVGGIAVSAASAVVVKCVDVALKRRKGKQAVEAAASVTADAIAKAEGRKPYTVEKSRELQGGHELKRGDQFKAYTRDDDVIMIEVLGDDNNPYSVSGALLEEISDFQLDDIDDF